VVLALSAATTMPARFAATESFQAAFAILAAGPLIGTFCMLAVREPS